MRISREKTLFSGVVLVEVQQFRTGSRHGLEILHQCRKSVEIKRQKVLGVNSLVCRSYRGETGRVVHFAPWPILNKDNNPQKVQGIRNYVLNATYIHIFYVTRVSEKMLMPVEQINKYSRY